MKLAGVVVLYNPDEENVIDNINSYINDIELLIAIDNSDKQTEQNRLISFLKQKKVIYIKNENNLGIAKALNMGAELAIENGYKWLLTMDQDSTVTSNMINTMLGAISDLNNIGIISPVHSGELIEKKVYTHDFEEVESAMTSGNLLNLEAFRKVGSFNEQLFIDYVDHEYCLRLRRQGFKIITASKAILNHNLGRISQHRLGKTTNHNFIRRYYITRNRLFVRKVYKNDFPEFCKNDYAVMWKEFVKICILEENKLKKIRAFILGFYHFKTNKFGKLS